jgi:hypothetical protein
MPNPDAGTRSSAMMTVVIATSRVARQINQWSRFAAAADEVTIAQDVLRDAALRQEAVCAAQEGLRHIPAGCGGHRVSVVHAVTSQADTSVGRRSGRVRRTVCTTVRRRSTALLAPRTPWNWIITTVPSLLVLTSIRRAGPSALARKAHPHDSSIEQG